MIETESVRELRVVTRLVYDGKEVQALERPFAMQEESDNQDNESRTLDDIVTEFADTLLKAATEMGYTISKEVLVQAMISLLLYLIRQDGDEKTIEVQLSKTEVKENGDKANPS
ncbi:MAG: hypothetical protein QXW91_00845 [Candidatus Nitrosotenuis sp.]